VDREIQDSLFFIINSQPKIFLGTFAKFRKNVY
jgi:hypothetical protein